MQKLALHLLIALPLLLAACGARHPSGATNYRVVRTLPHDPDAFTQGLLFHDGKLYESTGLYGQSTLREVNLETGEILRQHKLPRDLFGEGLAIYSNRLYQLTWREEIVMVYDLETFRPLGNFPIEGEGWGLAIWSNQFVASDGTATLRFYDPATKQSVRSIAVRDGDKPIVELNELEVIEGELWANVWHDDRVVRIDPLTGKALGWLDFSDLVPDSLRDSTEAVLNGIAYNPETRRIYITGKNWPVLYEIEMTTPPAP